MKEGQLLWTPSPERVGASNIVRYIQWLKEEKTLEFSDYESLRRWSVSDIEAFWGSLWDYFDVQSSTKYRHVVTGEGMLGSEWFEGCELNYAEHILRAEKDSPERTVLHHGSEFREFDEMSWAELGDAVRVVATQLRALDIKPGDRIASYMPNVRETVIAMLASMAVGAVWSSTAPEFGAKTVVERLAQIQPTLLFACDGYRFGGKNFSREAEVREIVKGLPSLKHVVWRSFFSESDEPPHMLEQAIPWSKLVDAEPVSRAEFSYTRVPHDHPLWVLFSSGTTGLPKAIVHSHAGVLMEHLKMMHFHLDLKPDSVMFFYTTTGWVMFNMLIAALLTGAGAVLYDGSPTYPAPGFLWDLAAKTGVTSFGASPTYVQMLEKAGFKPSEHHDLERLESVFVSGAPATPETFDWFYRCVKEDLWLTSQSGGTEVAGAFVGSVPVLPVYAGEIQCRCLGMDVHSWNDDGTDVSDEVGELVLCKPFPSMPMYFWNDEENRRYREAYFDVFPGVWRHGDFLRINDRGGCYIKGRSDSTLNRYGVRIGTAEIYRTVEQVDGIADSLIVCCELSDGNFFMPLFVSLKPGVVFDEALNGAIVRRLRHDCSPRHVPDRIYVVNDVPYTLTGKKMEVPVRKILMGTPLEKAASMDAMKNPESMEFFVKFALESTDYNWRAHAV